MVSKRVADMTPDEIERKREYGKRYREANRVRIRQYRDANRDHIRQQNRDYYEANRERILQRDSRRTNPRSLGNAQQKREYKRSYYALNLEHMRQLSRESYARNKSQRLATKKSYTESNMAAIRAYAIEYGARGRESAVRAGCRWTTAEDAVVLTQGLPLTEMAYVLRRSVASVMARRRVLRTRKQHAMEKEEL